MYSMAKTQINLDDEEDKILEAFRFVSGGIKDKRKALKKLIRDFAKCHPKTKEALKLRYNQK